MTEMNIKFEYHGTSLSINITPKKIIIDGFGKEIGYDRIKGISLGELEHHVCGLSGFGELGDYCPACCRGYVLHYFMQLNSQLNQLEKVLQSDELKTGTPEFR